MYAWTYHSSRNENVGSQAPSLQPAAGWEQTAWRIQPGWESSAGCLLSPFLSLPNHSIFLMWLHLAG
jgi:hypothetical protein